MYKFLTKNGQLLAFGLGVLLTAIFLIGVFSGLDSFNALPEDERISSGIFNSGLVFAIGLAILCAVGMVLFGIYQVGTNLKNSTKGLIGVGAIILIFLITRAMAGDDFAGPIAATLEKFNISESVSSNITGAMATTGILGALAIAAFVFF